MCAALGLHPRSGCWRSKRMCEAPSAKHKIKFTSPPSMKPAALRREPHSENDPPSIREALV
eukprot:7126549-Pyramimonas_sp.AAC.1